MCGIAGAFGAADQPALERMLAALAARGPDGVGLCVEPDRPAMLGHRRLAIIDPSPAGAQPMHYADGRLTVTYNGELYNHVELRGELAARGHAFRSRCDTEVLLAAYAEWGPACVNRLRGMFAFALLDRRPPPGGPDFVLARDRLGIKPLLFTRRGDILWFASEMRGLLAAGCMSRRLHAHALVDLLLCGSVLHPHTVLADAQALPPGHLLCRHGREERLTCYWDLHGATAGLRNELRTAEPAAIVEGVRERLRESARLHLVSDVPVGAFLSGGVDSTLAVALLCEAGADRPHTFCLGFDDPALDERAPARRVATALGTRHEEMVVSGADLQAEFGHFIRGLDRPSVDGFNTWLISRAAARQVKVAVSGLGSDEVFGGYGHFALLADAQRIAPRGWPALLPALRFARDHLHLRGALLHRLHILACPPAERLARLRRVLRPDVIARDMLPAWGDDMASAGRQRFSPLLLDDADGYQQVTYAEWRCYLAGTLLRDTDAVSMAHGLEVRPLFLDHPLVEFAYAAPAAVKYAPHGHKRLLLDAARDWVPAHVAGRAKQGFELPYGRWMQHELRDYFEAAFHSRPASLLLDDRLRQKLTRFEYAPAQVRPAWCLGIFLLWMVEEGCYL
jgi:asparagine synthase (glutamine-hydrolysing)